MEIRCSAFLFDLDGVLVDSRAVVERVTKGGRRANYPEQWVNLADGRRYRGKLWEKDDIRRLFVAGPFGDDEYADCDASVGWSPRSGAPR